MQNLSPLPYLGIDGCRAGWLLAARDEQGQGQIGLYPDLQALWAELNAPPVQVLIDMPIGLPDGASGPRRCDTLARQALGLRRASVFPVPCRAALAAATYVEASACNAAVLGRKLSRQTWHLMPRIAALDQWLDQLPRSAWPREAHPELAFAALYGGTPLPHYKKSPAGQALRLEGLRTAWPQAPRLYADALARYPRRAVAADDILDALALAWAATQPLHSLPPQPPLDAADRPMEIVCPGM